MGIKYFLKKIKDVKLQDYFSFFKLFLALCARPFYRQNHKGEKHWVVCETPNEARDNGYWFFVYMRTKHPDFKCYYAINYHSPDYDRVKDLGGIIKYGSVRHWLYYLTAQYNISSQKGGKPNSAVCLFMELSGLMNSHLVFLQHGVTINKVEWAFADVTKLDYFICSAVPEYEYVLKHFGYTKEQLLLTGMPRFDNLHHNAVEKKRVLIMPTWRSRFNLQSTKEKDDVDFLNSTYFIKWKELLNSVELQDLIREYHLEVIFYPHRNMQNHLKDFSDPVNSRVVFANWKQYEIQELMKTSAMMITDYSSVFFDMVYMKKPVLFYQFDYEEFRRRDYERGYFDYKNNPFGKSFSDKDGVIQELKVMIQNDFTCNEMYLTAHAQYFSDYDENNSQRIYKHLAHQ